VPPAACGRVLAVLDAQIRGSVSMAFRGRSRANGRAPAWLEAATDVRFVGLEGAEATILHFEAPLFGEAAAELYGQQEFWPSRPDPGWTGFEVLAAVLEDLTSGNEDSDRYDRSLLRSFRGFERVLNGVFHEARVEEKRRPDGGYASVNRLALDTARRLGAQVPPRRAARVVGKLDMIRSSTQTFALRLDSGDEVRGVLLRGDIGSLTALFGRRVAVLGQAVYRPSGRLLRLDAETMLAGDDEPALWSKVPPPLRRSLPTPELRRPQTATSGVNTFFGRWPGDETDEELLEALEALR